MKKFIGLLPLIALALLIAGGCGGPKTGAKSPDEAAPGGGAPGGGKQAAVPAQPKAVTDPASPKPADAAKDKTAAEAKKPGAPAAGKDAAKAPGRPPKAGPGGPGGPGQPRIRPAAKVDIPVYPRAKAVLGKDGKGPGPGMKVYSTTAKFDDVVKWYRKSFKGDEAPLHPDAQGKMAAFRKINEKTGDIRIVNIAKADKGVEIALAQMTVPKEDIPKLTQRPEAPPEMPKDVRMVRDKEKAVEQVGLPLYPNGQVKNGVLVTRDSVPDLRQVGVEMTSADGPGKVFEWYKGQLKGKNLQEEKSEKGDAFALMYADAGSRTQFRIITGKVEGETVIQLVKMTLPAAPAGGGKGKAKP